MTSPFVSILIPAYNAEKWIADTLESAIAQTWVPKEIIVVDDGSTDRTLEVARKFESNQVRVITQKNQGAAATRNTCFSASRGDYIQWLDADDLLSPDKIAKQVDALRVLQNPRMLLSSSWGRFLYRPQRADFTPSALWCDLSPAEWLLRKMGQNLHMQTATWLVSRELTDAAGPWNAKLLVDDDGEYFCRVLLASEGVRFVPGAKVYYRASGNSSVSYIGQSNQKMEAQWYSMQLHIRYLRSLEDSERVRAACVRYLQSWFINFYPDRLALVEQAQSMARELGGQLREPELSWKYLWIRKLLGWGSARRVGLLCQDARWSLARYWDKTLFQVQGRKTLASQ